MKTSKVFYINSFTLILLSILVCFTSCEKPILNEIQASDSIVNQTDNDWVALLEGLNFQSGIIVEKDNMIQEAVNLARPGDAIYIESGMYDETVNITKPDIQLIGLPDAQGEIVTVTSIAGIKEVNNVEIRNIINKDGIENNKERYYERYNNRGRIVSWSRSAISDDIAHYQFEVDLGNDEFDKIRIHRVVKERRPYRPIRTKGAVFMIHGVAQDFDDIFLRPGVDQPNSQNSSPIYLSQNGIDVWGIDLAWTLVPPETTDFAFMQNWGVERDVDHTLKAMFIARLIRGLTRQGFDRLNLLGFSYGVAVAYTAAGRETQQYPILRDIKGIIAAEGAMKYDNGDEASRIATCNRVAVAEEFINNGIFQNNLGLVFGQIGDLAVNKPDEQSADLPWLNNRQAALFFGVAVFPDPPAPFWHFVGGELQGNPPVPQRLLYTDSSRWIQLLQGLAPYHSRLGSKDLNVSLCNEEDTTIDDHLSKIKVPILYLGAAGGFGEQGLFTSGLTASTDITEHIVKLKSDQQRILDYGHADLFMGEDAAKLVWKVLLQWLVHHNHRPES